MSHKLKVSQVTFGGNAVNNPVPLSQANYYLNEAELKNTYRPFQVIAYHIGLQVNLQVTAWAVVDPATGNPKLNDTDDLYMPCPPFCYL